MTELKLNLKQLLRRIVYFGNQCQCLVCGSSLRSFRPMMTAKPRANASCPICGSLERHRLLWQFLKEKTDLLSGTQYRMLHLAPEDCFVSRFRQYISIEYLTADLNNPAMLKMDITDIQYPDNYFDIILCSHVLEHIPDDEKAMRELSRVLNPGGWAILQVPILVEKTFEDPAITDPLEREEKFGQSDHVRIYGLDYRQRLEKSGFLVDVVPFLDNSVPEIG
jgi:SAM-dependent methyltransferase